MSSFITYHQLIISFSTFNTPTINYPQAIASKLLIFQFFILDEANNLLILERFRFWFVIAFIKLNQLIRLVCSIHCILPGISSKTIAMATVTAIKID